MYDVDERRLILRQLSSVFLGTLILSGLLGTLPCLAQLSVCGDGLWELDPCEYCGQDAYAEIGQPELNHDCLTNIVDLGYFAFDYGDSAVGLSGDFNGDLWCNQADLGIFADAYFTQYGMPMSDCDTCGVIPDATRGTIRLSFSPFPEEDEDELALTPGLPENLYVVVEDCPEMTAVMWGLLTSPNIITSANYQNGSIQLGEATAFFTDDDSAYISGGCTVIALDDDPGWVKLIPIEDPAWDIAWAQIPPARRVGFERIAHAGINGPAPPDSIGIPEPPLACGDYFWTEEPCEYCGQDAFGITGVTEMNHDCIVDIIDLSLFYQEWNLTGPGLSGDFNRDEVVDISDFLQVQGTWNLEADPCESCSTSTTGCDGTVRISFQSDLTDVDRIDLMPYFPTEAYIVAENCAGLGAAHFEVVVSANVTHDIAFPTQLVIEEVNVPYSPAFGPQASLLATVTFWVTDTEPAYIEVVGSAVGGPEALRWVRVTDPIQRMAFATIAAGGINIDPPPDEDGCAWMDVLNDPTPTAALPFRIMATPNPATGEVRIALSLPQALTGRVIACDPAGRIVRQLHAGQLTAGAMQLLWDGCGDNGRRLASGAYYLRGEGAGGTLASSRVIWLR